jgi:hypothetical protein
MNNVLTKTATTTYTPGVAGTPPVAPSDGYTAIEWGPVCVWVWDSGGFFSSGHYALRCAVLPHEVVYPPNPGSPGTPGSAPAYNTDYNLGWNSGGMSKAFFVDDGYTEFKVSRSVVGVIIGLSLVLREDASYLGNDIAHAFYCARGLARIMENGVVIMNASPYSAATVFRIERFGTDILYRKDGVLLYTASGVDAVEPLRLESAMYSGQDTVFDPVITQSSPVDTSVNTHGTLAMTLPPLGMFMANTRFSELNLKLPPLGIAMLSGLPMPDYAVLGLALPPLAIGGMGLTGSVGTLDMKLPALRIFSADHPYGELAMDLPPLGIWGASYEGNFEASMLSGGTFTTTMEAQGKLVVTMNSALTITDAWTTTVQMSAEMFSSAVIATTFDLQAIYNATLNSRFTGGWVFDADGQPAPGHPQIDDGTETWAVNIATTGSTRYDRYGFNSYALIGGHYYGAKGDGITLLEGETDNGAQVHANIDFGLLDFGNQQKVTVEECFVGMSGKGNLFLKLTANGKSYTYKTQNFTDKLQQQRIKPGKGLRTNYVQLELYNEQGADFEIDTVRFMVVDLSRKL